jgi:adenine-specific DNA methylase
MAAALKPGGPLAFTFHHNKLEAYYAVGMAILDAGLVCTASFPCPAEMGGSIHIHGTTSSIFTAPRRRSLIPCSCAELRSRLRRVGVRIPPNNWRSL